MDPYRSPLLDRPGAVPAQGPDTGVALHHGDPLAEQRTAEAGAGVVDRSHRGVLRVGGTDRRSWLHSLTTQHLTDLPAARGTETLVLSPHGHVEHHALVADDGAATWLDVEPATAPALLDFLDAMRFLLDVDPADVTPAYAVLTLTGPTAAAVLGAAGHPAELAVWDVRDLAGGGWVRRVPWPGDETYDLLVPRDRLSHMWDALLGAGASPLGAWGWEALRVAVRRPRLGLETDHKTIPHEVGWLDSAVHLDKGCYRGQETVARVHNLGRPPRRLVLLHLDGGDQLPAAGEAVTTGDGETRVGFVGTAARHHELGPVALALVKRQTPDAADLMAGGVRAKIET